MGSTWALEGQEQPLPPQHTALGQAATEELAGYKLHPSSVQAPAAGKAGRGRWDTRMLSPMTSLRAWQCPQRLAPPGRLSFGMQPGTALATSSLCRANNHRSRGSSRRGRWRWAHSSWVPGCSLPIWLRKCCLGVTTTAILFPSPYKHTWA